MAESHRLTGDLVLAQLANGFGADAGNLAKDYFGIFPSLSVNGVEELDGVFGCPAPFSKSSNVSDCFL